MATPVIIDCESSAQTQLKPVPIKSVRLYRGFWADWFKVIRDISLPTQFKMLENTGRIDNFRRLIGDVDLPFKGYFFNDSDVYKWMEAVCWILIPDLEYPIREQLDEVIELISKAQDADGYINTYFNTDKTSERWNNLQDMHELYCAGHLIQAAIAHFRVIGEDDLLVPAVKLADHICSQFLRTNNKATPGHPEIEMALVELFRTTGESKYLDMARSFLDQRGYGVIGGGEYHQDHIPFRELRQLVGHAVRALYLCCGAADIYLEIGESVLLETLEYLWDRMVSTQLYISGGVGSRYKGEAFGDEFELPNARSYAETCAAIASFMWNWRMLHCTGDVKYADLMEWTLYNALLPGIGIHGDTYHYVNPLEVIGVHPRHTWFDCACCPTNIVRLLASISGYFYSHMGDNIWIHHYASNITEIVLDNGLYVRFSIQTDYPWAGEVEIELLEIENGSGLNSFEKRADMQYFGLHMRIPSWLSGKIPFFVNNEIWQTYGKPGSYLNIERNWKVGDRIKFNLPMRVRYLESHPYVYENSNRIAISRGPLLYCVEGNDNPNVIAREISITTDNDIDIQQLSGLPMNFHGLQINAALNKINDHWKYNLYLEDKSQPSFIHKKNGSVIALPYFAWGNRNNGWMQIWFQKSSNI